MACKGQESSAVREYGLQIALLEQAAKEWHFDAARYQTATERAGAGGGCAI